LNCNKHSVFRIAAGAREAHAGLAMKILLALILIVAAGAVPSFANPVYFSVDITRNDASNGSSQGGVYYTASPGINFGHPFGLTSFDATITFSEYVSISGYYMMGLESNGMEETSFGNYNWIGDEIYPVGGWAEETWLDAGISTFQVEYFEYENGFYDGSDAGVIGGPGGLDIYVPYPWGGDPYDQNATYYLVPLQVADSGSTLFQVVAGIACFAVTRKLVSRRKIAGA
jgi:hypothetical protein